MPGAVGSGSEWKGFTDYFSGAADLDTVSEANRRFVAQQ